MTLRSPKYSLREFSESVAHLDVLQIMDAILAELQAIKTQCRSLGSGNTPKKGSRARRYFDDLGVLIPLYTSTTPHQFRDGYIEEAWPMLRVLAKQLVSLSSLEEPKQADSRFTTSGPPRPPIRTTMPTQSYRVGFVYVLTNPAMPGLVKLGITESLPEDRAKDLYTTGVPAAFDVAFRAMTSRPQAVEKELTSF